MMGETIDVGIGYPTRVVAMSERSRGFWENEVQVDVGAGWEPLMSYNIRCTPERRPEAAFREAVAVARRGAAALFPSWLARRAARLDRARELAAKAEQRRAEHERAAPLRAAVEAAGIAELGRRADEAALAAEAKVILREAREK